MQYVRLCEGCFTQLGHVMLSWYTSMGLWGGCKKTGGREENLTDRKALYKVLLEVDRPYL